MGSRSPHPYEKSPLQSRATTRRRGVGVVDWTAVCGERCAASARSGRVNLRPRCVARCGLFAYCFGQRCYDCDDAVTVKSYSRSESRITTEVEAKFDIWLTDIMSINIA